MSLVVAPGVVSQVGWVVPVFQVGGDAEVVVKVSCCKLAPSEITNSGAYHVEGSHTGVTVEAAICATVGAFMGEAIPQFSVADPAFSHWAVPSWVTFPGVADHEGCPGPGPVSPVPVVTEPAVVGV